MLNWEVIWIKLDEMGPKLIFSREFLNGKMKTDEAKDEHLIFANYISLFPNKDIIRLDMNLFGNLLYSFYYIDKSYYDQGFIGVFGCEEYNTKEPYVWDKAEEVAKKIFKTCFSWFKDENLIVQQGIESMDVWFEWNIPKFFSQFREAKDIFSDKRKEKSREKLSSLFQSAATEKKKRRKKSSKSHEGKKTFEEDPQNIKKLQSMIDRVAYDQLYASDDEREWLKYRRRFNFMLINAFGNPLTDILNFQNGKRLTNQDETEETMQSLEGMTYSVLKSFVDQTNLQLHKMIVRHKESTGYEHIFFHNFSVAGINYLIIMDVENYDPKKNQYLSEINGDEAPTMDRIAAEIRQNSRLFTEDGQFINEDAKKQIEAIFQKNCEKTFFQ